MEGGGWGRSYIYRIYRYDIYNEPNLDSCSLEFVHRLCLVMVHQNSGSFNSNHAKVSTKSSNTAFLAAGINEGLCFIRYSTSRAAMYLILYSLFISIIEKSHLPRGPASFIFSAIFIHSSIGFSSGSPMTVRVSEMTRFTSAVPFFELLHGGCSPLFLATFLKRPKMFLSAAFLFGPNAIWPELVAKPRKSPITTE